MCKATYLARFRANLLQWALSGDVSGFTGVAELLFGHFRGLLGFGSWSDRACISGAMLKMIP